ncbi:12835_t:CDS:2, partial [Ambispora gerdemannii]
CEAGIDTNEQENTKLQKAALWGECKFASVVRHLDPAPANITDEAIDLVPVVRDKVIRRNTQ